MERDWWWPWWISTAIDVVIALLALVVIVRFHRPYLRAFAAVVACAALVAAALAPVVMQQPTGEKPSMFKKSGEGPEARVPVSERRP